jgi:lysophospholipase L1-like esterase
MPASGRRAAAFNVLLLLGGVLLALLLLEAFLRVYDPFQRRLAGDRLVLPASYRQVITNTKSKKLPPTIVFSKNALGFRGPEPPHRFEELLSIVAVGGSTTESRYATDGESWPERLGRVLEPRFRGLWVNNAGLDGHSTFGHLLLLEQRLRRLRPRVVLYLVGINDVGRDDLKRVDGAIVDEDPDGLTRLARFSAVAATWQNLLRSREARRRRLFTYADLDLAWLPHFTYSGRRPEKELARHRDAYVEPYRARLRELVARTREAGAVPVLVTQPALYGPAVDDLTGVDLATVEVDHEAKINGGLAWAVLELYNDATRDVAAESGAPLLELGRTMPKSSRLFYDFIHFTPEGTARVAAILEAPLCRALAGAFPDRVRAPCPP